jgi:hypothetical protein
MLSISRKTILASAAVLSLALVGAAVPASAQIRTLGGAGGMHGGFSGGGAFHGGMNSGAFTGGAFRSAPAISSGVTFNNSGGFRTAPIIENRAALDNSGLRSVNNPGVASNVNPSGQRIWLGGGNWDHHHHHHHFFGGFAPFAYYGGYPYYDSGYDNDYSYDDCTEYRPVYDRYGRYLGRRPVNVC